MTTTTFEDLLLLNRRGLERIMDQGHPIDLDAVAGRQYLGTDLSMPKLGHRLLWQTFRKCFVRDEVVGDVRGWNVRMEQRGFDGPQVPKRNKDGSERSFAHYRIRSATGRTWPRGWHGAQYFDYSIAGNPFGENLGFTPVVAVNEGSAQLILGWEIFKVGGRLIAPPLYWALRDDGPVETIAEPPRPPRP